MPAHGLDLRPQLTRVQRSTALVKVALTAGSAKAPDPHSLADAGLHLHRPGIVERNVNPVRHRPHSLVVRMEDVRFDTKIAVVLREDIAVWQKTNVTAFLISGIAATVPDVVGEPYVDASGTRYLPMLRQPVLVFAADGPGIRRAYERARERGLELAIFTNELFSTLHDGANRAAVAAVASEALDLVGIAMRADRKVVDKVVDRLRRHP